MKKIAPVTGKRVLDVRFSSGTEPETDGLPARIDRLIACAFEPDAVTTCRWWTMTTRGHIVVYAKCEHSVETSRDRSNVKRVPISSVIRLRCRQQMGGASCFVRVPSMVITRDGLIASEILRIIRLHTLVRFVVAPLLDGFSRKSIRPEKFVMLIINTLRFNRRIIFEMISTKFPRVFSFCNIFSF